MQSYISKRLINQTSTTVTNFTNIISQTDWSEVLKCRDVKSAFDTLINVFNKCFSNCFLFVTVKPSGAKKLWCKRGILNSCRTKNKLYRKLQIANKLYVNHPTPENKAAYTRCRNKLTTVIRVAKFNFHHREFSNRDIKGTWNAINTILHGCRAQGNPAIELTDNKEKMSPISRISVTLLMIIL